MPALYDNFRSGTLTDNPLTVGATTANSVDFASLPTVAAPDYMWLVFDPAQVTFPPEVVKVTTHNAASQTIQVMARAQQGSTARQWPINTVWIHVLTEADAQEWVTLSQTIKSVTTTPYTLILTDRGKFIQHNVAGAASVVVPTNAAVAFAIGDSIDGMQYGAGQITFSGVTIRGTPTLKTRALYSAWTLKKLATDEWLLTGDLASV